VTRLLIKILAAVVAAAVGVGLALQGAEVWAPSDAVVVSLIISAAVLAAGSTAGSAIAEFRARQIGARREFADRVLTGTLWAVVDATGLDFRALGLAAYRVRRLWWRPWRSELARVYRVRSQYRLAASGITWTPGKGVVGVCVAQQQVVAKDLRMIDAAIWPCTETEWDTVAPPDVRLGLTYTEYLEVRGKYDVVVAAPILDVSGSATRAVGCVALDGPAGSLDKLDADEIHSLLDSAAQNLLVPGR